MRIGATTLESFQLYMDPNQEWMSEDDILAAILGTTVPTPKMMVGTAFGRALEKPDKYRQPEGDYRVPVKVGADWIPFWFAGESIERALTYFDRSGVFEVPMTKEYGDVRVIAKADQMAGRLIVENKARIATSFEADKYLESVQWRFMLDLSDADLVQYNVFLLDDNEELFRLRSVEQLRVYPYPSLHDDCADLVRRFREFVVAKGLVDRLNEKQAVVEAKYAKEL